MRWARHVAHIDEKCIQNFHWKTLRKEALRRARCRWEDNIRMDLREVGWEGVDWIHMAQDRIVACSCIHGGNEPYSSIFLDYLSDYQLLKDTAPWS
jgi:hypothetical protein